MTTKRLDEGPALPETPSAPAGSDPYLTDRYFTDGINLYRVAAWVSRPGEQPLAELEDCHSLHSTLLERDALVELALEPVGVTAP